MRAFEWQFLIDQDVFRRVVGRLAKDNGAAAPRIAAFDGQIPFSGFECGHRRLPVLFPIGVLVRVQEAGDPRLEFRRFARFAHGDGVLEQRTLDAAR